MYGKVFTQMYDGTLVTRGPWQALVTFQQLIVLCDSDGIVDMTPEVISRRTTIPLEIIKTGIAALEQPDPYSRLPAEEGRRIVRLADHRDWGWQIVNHAHYQKIRNNEDRREYMREYMREYRKQSKQSKQTLARLARLADTDTDTNATTTTASNDISFDAESVGWRGILGTHMKVWAEAYPAVDLNAELNSAAAWVAANPKNRKSNWGRFLTNWLKRSQDRAPARGNGPAARRPEL